MTRTIFLVEDESIIREMYETAFKQRDYKVDSAGDGEEALTKLIQMPPTTHYDLILLDVMIPKLDGLSVLKKIKEPSSPVGEVPVFLLTNLGQENLIKEALDTGAERYFIKSNYIPKQLIDEIDAFFEKNK